MKSLLYIESIHPKIHFNHSESGYGADNMANIRSDLDARWFDLILSILPLVRQRCICDSTDDFYTLALREETGGPQATTKSAIIKCGRTGRAQTHNSNFRNVYIERSVPALPRAWFCLTQFSLLPAQGLRLHAHDKLTVTL